MRNARACTPARLMSRDANVRWRGIDPHLKTFFGRDLPTAREVIAEEREHLRELKDLAAISSYADCAPEWELTRLADECLGDWTQGLYALEDVLMQRGVADFHDVAYALYRAWSIEDAERSDRRLARMIVQADEREEQERIEVEGLMRAPVSCAPPASWTEAMYGV